MSSIIVRSLDDAVKKQLAAQAEDHGRPVADQRTTSPLFEAAVREEHR